MFFVTCCLPSIFLFILLLYFGEKTSKIIQALIKITGKRQDVLFLLHYYSVNWTFPRWSHYVIGQYQLSYSDTVKYLSVWYHIWRLIPRKTMSIILKVLTITSITVRSTGRTAIQVIMSVLPFKITVLL